MATHWKPIEDLTPIEPSGSLQLLREQTSPWNDIRNRLDDRQIDKTRLDIWLRERNCSFAIGTGEIEGLYTLKRGITEQLITRGLHGIQSSHTYENIDRTTLQGLLTDQAETLETVFDIVENDEQ